MTHVDFDVCEEVCEELAARESGNVAAVSRVRGAIKGDDVFATTTRSSAFLSVSCRMTWPLSRCVAYFLATID